MLLLIYRQIDGKLYEQRVSENGSLNDPVRVSDRIVVQNAVDSDQTCAMP